MQKTKLVGPWVFGTVEPNVEITSYVDRLMVRGDSVEDRGQFVKKNFCCTATEPGRYNTTNDDCRKPPDGSTNADRLECCWLVVDDDRRQYNTSGSDDYDAAVVDSRISRSDTADRCDGHGTVQRHRRTCSIATGYSGIQNVHRELLSASSII